MLTFVFANKSGKNDKLDVVQQLINTYFEIQLNVHNNWIYHPNATEIEGSQLKADFSKEFNGLKIHMEVQLGNMARWYSDIFKFQTAYSTGFIDMGISVIPYHKLGKRMDSNVANFERCKRELPSAKMSITLPILLIGIYDDTNTHIYDVNQTKFSNFKTIIGKGNATNKYRIINAVLNSTPLSQIDENSPVGYTPG